MGLTWRSRTSSRPSPTRPHVLGQNALEADPPSVGLLADAGFDGMAIANNHAGDAGPQTITDTMAALQAQGIAAIGAGTTLAEATAATVFAPNGVRVAVLAFDLTHGGPPAGAGVGVARWDPAVARAAVATAAAPPPTSSSSVSTVGSSTSSDPIRCSRPWSQTSPRGESMSSGVTVRTSPTPSPSRPASTGGTTVQAPGLGNAVFDQRMPRTQTGTMLEVLTGPGGVLAWRTASIGTYLRATFDGWDLPAGDAASVDGEWWNPIGPLDPAEPAASVDHVDGLVAGGVLVSARRGDVDGDGLTDVVASYRRSFRPRLLQQAFPDTDFIDASGQ